MVAMATIHINYWSLQPFRQYYDLISHTTYDVCVNLFIHERLHLQFKVNSERQIFKKQFYLFSLCFYQKSADGKSSKKYFVIFRLVGDA